MSNVSPSTFSFAPLFPNKTLRISLYRNEEIIEQVRPTVRDSLEVIIGLNIVKIGTNKLEVNLVLDIRKQDESCHHTLATATLHFSGNLAVPDVVVVGEQSADGAIGHGEEKVAILGQRLTAVHPIGLASISQVLGVDGNVVQVVPGVGLVLTDGRGGARAELEGRKRVTST